MRLFTNFCLLPSALCLLLTTCAQQGSLTGGLKDEKPPEILVSVPPNYTTHFNSDKIEITFNEYISLKDIAKQLVVSPPMAKKPDIKARGRTLVISFEDSLQPDRTYAINFGDALVDLNESNPMKNFQFVFSTGSTIDSLQASGKVLNALDSKPMEDILVMLYSGTADSLPLKTIPLYISRTNKEGKFTLRNLAGGSYKIFALKDGNTNYLFDMPSELVAFQDSLIVPSVAEAVDSVTVGITAEDSVKIGRQAEDSVKVGIAAEDSVKTDTMPVKPKYFFKPDDIELRMFTEVKPSQYLAGADRLRRDQIRIKFNQKIDSLKFDFLNLPQDSVAVSLEWTGDADTVDFWIMNPSMAARDSMTAILEFPAYDSVERPVMKTDTAKLRYRAVPKPTGAPKNEFALSVSIEKTKSLEFGQPVIFTTSLPYVQIDTTLIRLVAGKDSAAVPVPFRLVPDTIRGLVMNGLPIIQTHPRIISLTAAFVSDTSYRLKLLPGAFRGMGSLKSDSVDFRFKMKKQDEYGSVKIELPSLKGPAVLELLDARNAVVGRRVMDGRGTATFALLPPGKYAARLIFDTNRNGRWDTGRYILHLQPERVISFSKELNLKANWEVSEIWQWEDL